MSALDRWFAERIPLPATLSEHTLVLARTRGMASLVRRWIARRGAVSGIEVLTPRSLAAQLMLEAPEQSSPPLPDDAMAAQIGPRPGLASIARRHAEHLCLRRLAGAVPASIPAWLHAWVDHGVGNTTETAAFAHLLRAAARGGRTLSTSHTYHHVIALGFDVAADAIYPWDDTLLTSLFPSGRPENTCPAQAAVTSLPALRAPDVVAAARLAIRAITATEPEDVLFLVSERATAERVHATLSRNGIPSSWQGPVSLQNHTLSGSLRRMVSWCEGRPDPLLRNTDLASVFSHPLLGRCLPDPARLWLEARTERPWLSQAGRTRVIDSTRLLDAPLSRWVAALEAQEGGFFLSVRLRLLGACVRGERFADAFADPDTPSDTWSDFEATLGGLSGEDQARPSLPNAGTLGVLRRFLLANHVSSRDNHAVQAILGALRAARDLPATQPYLRQVLSGSIDPRQIAAGAQICLYEDYDGRPSTHLVLLDLHNHGITRRPSPDPFLSEAASRDLGVPSGTALIRIRLAHLHLARSRARTCTVIVSDRDASGRAVVPPIQLDLDLHEEEVPGFGIGLPIPEAESYSCLHVTAGRLPASPPPGDPRLVAASIQMSAEWMREGRALGSLVESAPPPHKDTSLAEILEHAPRPPAWLAPYLGDTRKVPEALLPDAAWSTSRLFRPLTHCLYQAFGTAVLGLRERQEVSEDLDPREIGEAVHAALEAITPVLHRRPERWEEEAARRVLLAELKPASASAFATVRDQAGGFSAARRSSADGHATRWARHWESWVLGRIRHPPQIASPILIDAMLTTHPAVLTATEALTQVGSALSASAWTIQQWVLFAAKRAAKEPGGADTLATSSPYILLRRGEGWRSLSPSWEAVLRRFLHTPVFAAAVKAATSAQESASALYGDVIAEVAEVVFGQDDPRPLVAGGTELGVLSAPEVLLQMGKAPVRLQGRIDRISLIAGSSGPLLQILDYKTSRVVPEANTLRSALASLRSPQLVVYALALRAMSAASSIAVFRDARVATLGYDYVRQTVDARNRPQVAPLPALVDDTWLDSASQKLGTLLDRGRAGDWQLHPHSETCPRLGSYGHDHCPLARACRLRSLPPSASEEAP